MRMNIFALIGVVVVSVVAYLLVLLILMIFVGGHIDSEEATIGSIILGVFEGVVIGLMFAHLEGVL